MVRRRAGWQSNYVTNARLQQRFNAARARRRALMRTIVDYLQSRRRDARRTRRRLRRFPRHLREHVESFNYGRRHHAAATVIQRAWRDYVQRRRQREP